MRVFGVAGHSGMGKTTLLEKLIPEISSRGLIVSLIKHSLSPEPGTHLNLLCAAKHSRSVVSKYLITSTYCRLELHKL